MSLDAKMPSLRDKINKIPVVDETPKVGEEEVSEKKVSKKKKVE